MVQRANVDHRASCRTEYLPDMKHIVYPDYILDLTYMPKPRTL